MSREKSITIREATPGDASEIADAIMMAVGDELVDEIANGHGRESVHEVFSQLALRTDTQYSYKNAIVAEDREGKTAGIVVAYDGKILLDARRHFFVLAKEILGWDIYDMVEDGEPEVETDASEYYLDSLAVWPEYRGRGIATALIEAVMQKGSEVGKPTGLLCAEHNDRARRLYEQLGFREIGKRPFAGETMSHMLR